MDFYQNTLIKHIPTTVHKETMMLKNLTNLHLPRFDEFKVDETLDFISASKIYFGETGLTWLGVLAACMTTSVVSTAPFAFVTKGFVTAVLADAIASVGTLSHSGPRGSDKVADDEQS